MISRLIAKATLVGVAASLAVAAPAAAAAPVLDAHSPAIGFSEITLTGTATPNATVHLYEAAYEFARQGAPLYAAPDYSGGEGATVTRVANAQGKFSIPRDIDSGFRFAVEVDGVRSNTIDLAVQQQPFFASATALDSPSNNTVTATVVANPGQPELGMELQRQASNGTWTKIAEGRTGEKGVVTLTATGVSGGVGSFRAFAHSDANTLNLQGSSAVRQLTVKGTVTNPPSTPPSTPPTTPPTTPKPTIPAVGAIQFTRIQYDSPGTDSGSNGSLNTEWVKLTNKTKATINLNGWTVRDAANHVYKFVGTYNLGAGQSVFVITGKGKNVVGKKYWNRVGKAGYIWNNTGDTAIVRHASGKTIDSCKWTKVGTGYTNC